MNYVDIISREIVEMDTKSIDLESIREHIRVILDNNLIKLRENCTMNCLHCVIIILKIQIFHISNRYLGISDEISEIIKDREDSGEIITLMEFFDHIFEKITESISEISARVFHNLDNIEKSLENIRAEISSGFNISVDILKNVLELRINVILVVEEVGRSVNIHTILDGDKTFNGIIDGQFEGFMRGFDDIREILDDFQKLALINVVSEEKDVSDKMGNMEKIQIVNIKVLRDWGLGE